MDLLVTRENAIPLEEGEYFIADIIGCKVITDEGQNIRNAYRCFADRRK